MGRSGCCHQPMRRKCFTCCFVSNKGMLHIKARNILNTFFCLTAFLVLHLIIVFENLSFVDQLIDRLSRVSYHPGRSCFYNNNVLIQAEKTTRRTPCLVCPLLRLTTWSGEADSTNYWSQRLTDSWHPMADFLSRSPTPDCSPVAQKDGSSGSIGQSFNQSNPHRRRGSAARTFIGCSLIIFQMITVAVRRPTLEACTCTRHTQHISLPFPLSIYAQRRVGELGGWDSLCAAASA